MSGPALLWNSTSTGKILRIIWQDEASEDGLFVEDELQMPRYLVQTRLLSMGYSSG
jgi:hypothetical protein